MSNINNYGVDMNKKTLAELNLSAVNELRDEDAAAFSGGAATIYRDANFKGGGLKYSNGDSNLVNDNFNDTTSSIIITGNERWRFYRDVNFQGPAVTLGRGRYSFVADFGIPNDSISSLRRL
ncbi:peptidase inhibitor family I36 protein [Nostoc sp. CHAB 5836]|uniref:beta/gamma crystallin-related protein n=1 Tax=Nostoc sp. CHAB 5836 TaxID=2780404 RepID=UPI001E2EF6B6|nr:beta/gamma crystallin-related protein [Nostoc sp. CHAB 5836]MCC5618776.1 peptidase inhibitor family I36 protein [Nostoc sp. CHAB 5836]